MSKDTEAKLKKLERTEYIIGSICAITVIALIFYLAYLLLSFLPIEVMIILGLLVFIFTCIGCLNYIDNKIIEYYNR